MKVGLIISEVERVSSANAVYLHNAFLRLQHELWLLHLPSIEIDDGSVSIMGVSPGRMVRTGEDVREGMQRIAFADLNLAWLLSHPHPSCEKDAYQMLWLASQQVQFVNRPSSILFLDSKHSIAAIVPPENRLRSLSTSDPQRIMGVAAQNAGKKWVLKPANGSNGASVFVLNPQDSNRFALAQMMTGDAAAIQTTYGASRMGFVGRFCVMQEFNEAASAGEKRILIAGGEVVGAYAKFIGSGDHRASMIYGSRQELASLNAAEMALSREIASRMKKYGLHYCGMDVGFPYVYELNFMSPTGLLKFDSLGGGDRSGLAVSAVLEALKLN